MNYLCAKLYSMHLRGVILCGGQSTRMGTDKGMLAKDNNTWANSASNKMLALSIPTLFSVNNDQYDHYARHFDKDLLVKDNVGISLKGPLLGIESVHVKFPENDLFVLACDMPLMEVSVLRQLLDFYNTQAADAFIFTNNGEYEPLCGIYTASALKHILQLFKNGQLLKHSMKYALENIKTATLPITEEEKKYFRNINAHADLNGL